MNPGGLADNAGLKVGDRLVKVDGYSCRDMKPENIIDFIKSNLHTFGSIEFIVSGLEPFKAISKVKNQERNGEIRSQSVPRNEPQLAIELTPVNQKKNRTNREPRSVRRNVPREVSCHVQKNIGEPTFGFKLDFVAKGKPVPSFVKEVTPGSAADRAGLKVGDFLERVNKRSVIGLSRPEVLIMVAKFPTAVTFDVRRGDNPQVQQSQSFQMSSAPMPPPPTQPPPKFSPPSITNAPTIPVIPTVPTIPGATRKFEDEIVKVLSDRCRDSDKQPIEDYYRSCFQ